MTWLARRRRRRGWGPTAIWWGRASACCWPCWCFSRSAPSGSIPGSTGRRSSLRRRRAMTLADFATRSDRAGLSGGSALLFRACWPRCSWVAGPGDGVGGYGWQGRSRRGLLLADHHPFSDPGHGPGDWAADLGWAIWAGPGCSARPWPCWRGSMSGRGINRVSCSGRPHPDPAPGRDGGRFPDKPLAKGGWSLAGRWRPLALAAVILILIFVLPQKPGRHPGRRRRSRREHQTPAGLW